MSARSTSSPVVASRLALVGLLGGCADAVPPDTWPASGCTVTDGRAGRPARRSWSLAVDGATIAIAAEEPRRAGCMAAVVLVPGGLQEGLSMLSSPLVESLNADGVAVYSWDPRGRGESTGVEDANGAQGQDDLAAVMRWIAAREEVDPDAVVLYTRSLGVALGAGALARHPDLRPRRWIDYEGPGWLEEDLEHAVGRSPETLRELAEASGDPEAWWAERTPAAWISETTVPYRRLQGLPDHALGPRVAHTVAMLSGGTDAQLNGIPAPDTVDEAWVQTNVIGGGLSYDGADAVALVRAAME